MSVWDEGWDAAEWIPQRHICGALDCCNYDDEGGHALGGWCEKLKRGIGVPVNLASSHCPFAPILRALPSASEERIFLATKLL